MNHLLPNHLSIIRFAEKKQVYPGSVYDAIKAKKILVDLVGKDKVKMIDYILYRQYRFAKSNPDKAKLKAWYARKGRALKK